jgi:hypothetical protein
MGLEWVLLSLMVTVALWLGLDACRESKRLHDRLSRVGVQRPAGADVAGWASWPLAACRSEELHVGQRL